MDICANSAECNLADTEIGGDVTEFNPLNILRVFLK